MGGGKRFKQVAISLDGAVRKETVMREGQKEDFHAKGSIRGARLVWICQRHFSGDNLARVILGLL